MSPTPLPNPSSSRKRWLWGLLALLLLVATVGSYLLLKPSRSSEDTGGPVVNQAQPLASPLQVSATNLALVGSSSSNSLWVDEETMLKALVRWVKRRDGKDVRIIESQRIHDALGKPVSLSVLVTGLPQGIAADEFRQKLAALASRESGVLEALRIASGQQATQAVNRLAAQFSEGRTAFITANQLSSYRLSLSRQEPPVLAFWDGLTYEKGREIEARKLAAGTLGDTAALQDLVVNTSVAALLRFTNNAGSACYVDPVRMARVPSELIANRAGKEQFPPDDSGRAFRIRNQWAEMLARDLIGTN